MKKFFYFGALLLALFEIANVYSIMPIPGSQEMESIGLAYFLFKWKWTIRVLCIGAMLYGLAKTWKHSKVLTIFTILLLCFVGYMTNFKMQAEHMFYEPREVIMKTSEENKVPLDKLVLGVTHNGVAAAFPVNYLAYHHKVHATINSKPLMATYCTVCRTGRVFEPIVNGKQEKFRLVGMDHYNAMFEDASTHTWWRQVTGEAVAGKLKGNKLPDYPFVQTTLQQWLTLYPESLIMQPDPSFRETYEQLSDFEKGTRGGRLTRRDTIPWNEKAWVAGIELPEGSKAYDWMELERMKLIHDEIGGIPVVLFLANDGKSLFAFHREKTQTFTLLDNVLSDGVSTYNLMGHAVGSGVKLKPVKVSQEYWHSWRTFHPETERK